MAVTVLAPQTIVQTGLDPAYTSANGDGHYILNNGRMFVHLVNGSGGDITATVEHPGTVDGLAVADLAVVVTAGQDRMIGPFGPNFNQSGTYAGYIKITFSGVTSLTIAALVI